MERGKEAGGRPHRIPCSYVLSVADFASQVSCLKSPSLQAVVKRVSTSARTSGPERGGVLGCSCVDLEGLKASAREAHVLAGLGAEPVVDSERKLGL